MTIQDIFNRMMLYDNQLSLLAGGDDVTRGIWAINLVTDWFEARAVRRSDVLQTDETFDTTANTEKTAWPSRLMRLDSLWRLDSDGYQVCELDPIDKSGGHQEGTKFPFQFVTGSSRSLGPPEAYRGRGQGGQFYWQPRPDAVYTMRAYGLWAVADYTAAANTFAHPDSVALVLAPFATKVFRIGLDRELLGVHQASESAFDAVLDALDGQGENQTAGYNYSEPHDT